MDCHRCWWQHAEVNPAFVMRSPFALSLAIVVALFPVAATSGPIFDSPGRGYREQFERVAPSRVPTDAVLRVSEFFGWTNREKEEPVAHYSLSDRGASDRIKRVLTEGGIPYLLSEDAVPTVLVKPPDRLKAKELLEKLPGEGHWSVTPITEAEVIPQIKIR